jgi:hypothetical protein
VTRKRIVIVGMAAAVVLAAGAAAAWLARASRPAAPRLLPAVVQVPGPFRSTGTDVPVDPQLYGVSCTSATNCTVVGSAKGDGGREVPLAERWNGRGWLVQPTQAPPGGGSLASVACVSPSDCIAVGFATMGPAGDEMPLAESWDGHKWVAEAAAVSGIDGALGEVSCTAATFCMAVGGVFHGNDSSPAELMERWDGHGWLHLATPAGRVMTSVSCTSPSACVAVGSDSSEDFGVYSESWDGTTWAIQANGEASTGDDVSGVSCTEPDTCTEVGSSYYYDLSPTASQWTGAGWDSRDAATPPDADTDNDGLGAVSCVSASACVAVGSYNDVVLPGDNFETLAERWNGSTWEILPMPLLGAREGIMDDVSCTSQSACMAVGNTDNQQVSPNHTRSWPLVERWNGRTWSIQNLRYVT